MYHELVRNFAKSNLRLRLKFSGFRGSSISSSVFIVYRSELKLKPREDLSGPDFLVIQLGNILIYNVYIYPESTQWAGVLENDPCEALAASLALAFTAHFLVALLGDLNARTAEMLANLLDPPRTSMDKETRTTRNSCTYSRTINKMRL
jgi:hypothetical protein